MTSFEMDYRKFQRNPKRHQISIDFEITMENSLRQQKQPTLTGQ